MYCEEAKPKHNNDIVFEGWLFCPKIETSLMYTKSGGSGRLAHGSWPGVSEDT